MSTLLRATTPPPPGSPRWSAPIRVFLNCVKPATTPERAPLLHRHDASLEMLPAIADRTSQEDDKLLMTILKFVILRCFAKRSREGRTPPALPISLRRHCLRRRRRAEPALQQRGPFRLGARQIRLLDVAEAADFERQRGQLDGGRVVGRRQAARSISSSTASYSAISRRSVRRSSLRPKMSKARAAQPAQLRQSAERPTASRGRRCACANARSRGRARRAAAAPDGSAARRDPRTARRPASRKSVSV